MVSCMHVITRCLIHGIPCGILSNSYNEILLLLLFISVCIENEKDVIAVE